MKSKASAKPDCKTCGKEIAPCFDWWYHTKTGKVECYPTTKAQPKVSAKPDTCPICKGQGYVVEPYGMDDRHVPCVCSERMCCDFDGDKICIAPLSSCVDCENEKASAKPDSEEYNYVRGYKAGTLYLTDRIDAKIQELEAELVLMRKEAKAKVGYKNLWEIIKQEECAVNKLRGLLDGE